MHLLIAGIKPGQHTQNVIGNEMGRKKSDKVKICEKCGLPKLISEFVCDNSTQKRGPNCSSCRRPRVRKSNKEREEEIRNPRFHDVLENRFFTKPCVQTVPGRYFDPEGLAAVRRVSFENLRKAALKRVQ